MPRQPIENKLLKSERLTDSVKKTTQFYKKTGMIQLNDLYRIIDSIYSVAESKNKLIKIPLIRIFNGDKVASFKTQEALEEYYEGKVRNPEKFYEYFQVQITTILAD
jgi:hypothetical protein